MKSLGGGLARIPGWNDFKISKNMLKQTSQANQGRNWFGYKDREAPDPEYTVNYHCMSAWVDFERAQQN
jgi:hypothetical protein